jgi:hypothetical protein
MNNELERTCKEAAMAEFQVIFWHLSGGTETTKNLDQDSQSPD